MLLDRCCALGAIALLAAGCSVPVRPLPPPDPLRASRMAREAQMTQVWQDQTLQQVLQARGRPQVLLDIPGGGNPPGFVLVYPRDAATGCLDTFTMAFGAQARVRSYQCR